MFFKRFVLLSTVSVALAWSSASLAARPVDGDPEIGQKLFFERGCASCHSFDGTPKQGPTLQGIVGKTRLVMTAENPREIIGDRDYIVRSILEPNYDIVQGYVPGAMPGLPITPDEARHLAAAIVKLSGPASWGEKAKTSFFSLILSALVFVFGHIGLSSIAVRRPFEKRLGAKGYQAIYSLVALGAMVWMVFAYRAAPYIELFRAPPWTRWIPNGVMPIALLFLLCSVTTWNPTTVGQEKAIEIEPRGILRITRHPMLWSFTMWGMAHMTANGDIASLIVFSSVALLSVLGMLHIEKRRRIALGEAWTRFTEQTALVPFSKGHIGQALREIGWVRFFVTIVLFGALLHFHKTVIGVSALP